MTPVISIFWVVFAHAVPCRSGLTCPLTLGHGQMVVRHHGSRRRQAS
jgi:hypothetical protein